jgi:hypothetical protein
VPQQPLLFLPLAQMVSRFRPLTAHLGRVSGARKSFATVSAPSRCENVRRIVFGSTANGGSRSCHQRRLPNPHQGTYGGLGTRKVSFLKDDNNKDGDDKNRHIHDALSKRKNALYYVTHYSEFKKDYPDLHDKIYWATYFATFGTSFALFYLDPLQFSLYGFDSMAMATTALEKLEEIFPGWGIIKGVEYIHQYPLRK